MSLQVVGTHAQLTWETVSGSDHYNIYRSNSIDGKYDLNEVAQVNHLGTGTQNWTDWSYHIFPGENQHTRYYRVTAVEVSGTNTTESITSNEVDIGYGGAGGGGLEKVADNNLSDKFKYNLSENYPNPFNPTTTVNYSVKEKGLTLLKIYNIMGEEVAVLVNEVKAPGNYRISFNAQNLPSGVYIYKIISGNYSKTKKMVLTK